VADEGREEEVITRLARVGFDNTLGFLKNGLKAWLQAGKEIDTIESVSASEFAERFKNQNLHALDVRKPDEFEAERIEGVLNIPLDFLNSHLSEIPKEGNVYLHCAGGYRSMIAASILKSRGWENVVDITGGLKALLETQLSRTNYVCPTTAAAKK
jgi:rhodanese-related sulfurtransferase